jgi:hypothetical protein
MSIIRVATEECSEREFEQLKPGSRVEYRGAIWKVVGIYFDGPQGSDDGTAASSARKRTKCLILRSLAHPSEVLRPFGAMRSL